MNAENIYSITFINMHSMHVLDWETAKKGNGLLYYLQALGNQNTKFLVEINKACAVSLH